VIKGANGEVSELRVTCDPARATKTKVCVLCAQDIHTARAHTGPPALVA
jgi:hypothetical protein